MKRIFIKIILFLFFSSTSFACSLLQVPIGSPISNAQDKFEFLNSHNSQAFGKFESAKYLVSAIDYCEGSPLENADLEVIVYDNKIAGIILYSIDEEFKNEIYEFVKFNISDPGDEVKNENWTGFKDLSIGALLIYYSKIQERGEIAEVLKITNSEMLDYTIGEQVLDANG